MKQCPVIMSKPYYNGTDSSKKYPVVLSSNSIHIMICIIGGLSCLLPLYFFPESQLEDTKLRPALSSGPVRDSAVAAVALVLPLIMEILTDVFVSCTERADRIKYNCRNALLNSPERFVFVCGTAIAPIIALLPRETASWAYIYLCCSKCQLMMVGGAVAVSFCRYDKRYWTESLTYLFLLLLTMGTVGSAFTDNQTAQTSETLGDRIRYASYSLVLMATLLFFGCSARWLRKVFPKLLLIRTLFHTSEAKECESFQGTGDLNCDVGQLIFPFMYISTSLAACLLLALIAILYPGISTFNTNALFFHNLSFIFFLLIINYTSIRMMRQQVVDGLVSLLVTYVTPYGTAQQRNTRS